MKQNLTCPSCGGELEIEDIDPGTVIECPGCHGACTVPQPPVAHHVSTQKKTMRVPIHRDTLSASQPVYTTSTVTIQKTAKKWKVLSLVGRLMIIAAVVIAVNANGNNEMVAGAFLLGFIGVVVAIVARVGKWWQND